MTKTINILIFEKNQKDWFLYVLLDQNLTISAGKCIQPLRPKKLIPNLFWAIPINFLSKNNTNALNIIKKTETNEKDTKNKE